MGTEREKVAMEEQPAGPIQQVQMKLKSLDNKAKTWIRKQPAAVEVAITTLTSSVQGGAIGAMMGTLTGDLANSLPSMSTTPETAASMQQVKALAVGPWVQARNIAVMTGVNAGILCALRRVRRGVDDVQNSMAAGFGSGLAFSLVSGVNGPNPAANALSTGVVFALFNGAFYKAGQALSQKKPKDVHYRDASGMLATLGLQKYEKNFKRGLLTDNTLPLLNDSALQEVRIPPGPRLLILDYVHRSQLAHKA